MALGRSGLIAAVVAIAIGITGVAAVSTGLVGNPLSASTQGPTPAGSLAAPAWQTNDTWVYNVTLSAPALSDRITVLSGQETDIVRGTLTDAAGDTVYNVTTSAVFDLRTAREPERLPGMEASPIAFGSVHVDGYTWYRTSDLAVAAEARTVTAGGTLRTPMGNLAISFKETTEATFAPALAVLKFPLTTNETWNSDSMANVTLRMTLRIDTPTSFFQVERGMSRDVPARLGGETGPSMKQVKTPDGNFTALPVRFEGREFNDTRDGDGAPGMSEHDRGDGALGMLAGMTPVANAMDRLGGIVASFGTPTLREGPGITAWYSAQAENVVKVTAPQAEGRIFVMALAWTNVT